MLPKFKLSLLAKFSKSIELTFVPGFFLNVCLVEGESEKWKFFILNLVDFDIQHSNRRGPFLGGFGLVNVHKYTKNLTFYGTIYHLLSCTFFARNFRISKSGSFLLWPQILSTKDGFQSEFPHPTPRIGCQFSYAKEMRWIGPKMTKWEPISWRRSKFLKMSNFDRIAIFDIFAEILISTVWANDLNLFYTGQ